MDKFVLFAEDDPIQARVLSAVCKTLALPPSNFVIVSNGAEAIDYFKRSLEAGSTARKPDLVISDLKMPEVDGLELLKWIREIPAFNGIHVIILTAAGDPSVKKLAQVWGCDGFFEKPVGLAKIAQTIQQALLLRNTEREGNVPPKLE